MKGNKITQIKKKITIQKKLKIERQVKNKQIRKRRLIKKVKKDVKKLNKGRLKNVLGEK